MSSAPARAHPGYANLGQKSCRVQAERRRLYGQGKEGTSAGPLTVCSLLHPALSPACWRVARNNHPTAGIFVNARVKQDFLCFAVAFQWPALFAPSLGHVGRPTSRSIATPRLWGSASDLPPHCLGLLTLSRLHRYRTSTTPFWYEALCVASAIE